MNTERIELALDIFDVGAVKDKSRSPDGLGFRLKLHEKNPDAPLSPFYMDLRTPDNPKGGLLTPKIVSDIGRQLFDHSVGFMPCKYLAGIPHAGDPFADSLATQFKANMGVDLPVLRMHKEGSSHDRKIGSLKTEVEQGARVIVVDDLITQAGSKIEAIKALEAEGLEIAGVVVLVDREQGGLDQITNAGYRCIAVFKVRDMLDLYLRAQRIDKSTYGEIMAYLFPEPVATS